MDNRGQWSSAPITATSRPRADWGLGTWGLGLGYPCHMSIHIVLVHPEIHWNTGNAGRTCLATGATLHLIEPLGFTLDDREVRRAGLDYWEHVDVRVWASWEVFEA